MAEQYSGADAFVEVMNAHGVESIFFNPGGEQSLIQATIAKNRMLVKPSPRLVLCLHEAVAMTAAHGHYVVSGKPQLVMVHSELGTQQVGGALHNAQWGRVPMVLFAGFAGTPHRQNWKGDPFDQGLMVRNSVKWDHQIGPDESVQEVLVEALKVAMTEPRGPVYITYSRDALAKKVDRVPIAPRSIRALPPPAAQDLARTAEILVNARNPLIVAGYTSRYPETIPALIELAETLAAPVLTSQVCLNFPTTHPLSAGIEQILGSVKGNPYVGDADVILVFDYDVPYAAAAGMPKADAKIVHFDVDPLTCGRPLWGRGADLFVKADSRQAIPMLTKALRDRITTELRRQFAERAGQIATTHRQWKSEWRSRALAEASKKPISPDWLCRCLADVMDEEMVLVNHTISHSASPLEQIERSRPGTLVGCPAGSIMFALGAALGAKVAVPQRTVVSIMTDGGFVWGSPVATLWSARAYKAPFLGVICDNQSYGFIHGLVRRTAGESESGFSDKMAFEAGVDFVPPVDYAGVAEACGAYGRTVEDPDDVPGVLRAAMDEVQHGRAAVVDARLERP